LDYNVIVSVRQVFDSPESRNYHADQGGYGVFEGLVLYAQDLQDEIKALCLGNLENVSSNQFFYQSLPQFRSDLQGVDS
jgi:hypothetical protein